MITTTETDIYKAAIELESLKHNEEKHYQNNNNNNNKVYCDEQRFPLHCLKLLYNIPGNLHCMDCNANNPQWASLTFGTLLCIVCSGRHRHMGVQVSFGSLMSWVVILQYCILYFVQCTINI